MNYEKYLKIPMKLLLDKNITANAKLLFGLLLVLSIKEGYCYADNNYIILKYKHRFIRKVYINDNVSNI